MEQKHIAIIVGARPNFIKAAAFLRSASLYPDVRFTLIHTGQHYDQNMSKIFFDEMSIAPPAIMLDIQGEFHTEKIGKMFNALRKEFESKKYDAVIVFGDVNSTLAGAVAAAKSMPIIHIESGLRSHDRRMPEEINRVIVDHLSDLLFTTEPSANENLAREGVAPEKVYFVGNLMIETYEKLKSEIEKQTIVGDLGLTPKEYIVATIHRQENTDSPVELKKILEFLVSLSLHWPIVFPLHPGTKRKIEEYGFLPLLEKFKVIEPLGYLAFMNLVKNSHGVVTDSGGIQEETTHLGVPCCTLRENTERPITLTEGSNRLFSPIADQFPALIEHLRRTDFRSGHIQLWDADVSQRIFEKLSAWLGL